MVGKVGEVGVDLICTHVFGVMLVMKKDVFSHPVNVCAFGTISVAARA